ncbi:MAG: four helix bundle protein [Nanoarchaeota archaeon]|nr:four helix bundle protein [Nanoarchaeota archaeon]
MWDVEKLQVYHRAIKIRNELKKRTFGFPKFEMYELGSQMRRAVASISANIREGALTSTIDHYVSYLHNAIGSASETRHHVEDAFDSGYFSLEDKERYVKELNEIVKMLSAVISFLKRKKEGLG